MEQPSPLVFQELGVAERITHFKRCFPKSHLCIVNGHVEGLWITGNTYRGAYSSGYHGSYPHSYLERVLSLFPDCKDFLHLFSGTVEAELTLDVKKELRPVLCADAQSSSVAHYRAEFLGRGTLADRQQRINRMLHRLLRTAEVNNTAVVITNQVQSTPETYFQNPTKPIGGHVLGHTSTYRIYLRKVGKNRIAKMVDSPCHPEVEAPFTLDEQGVVNTPDHESKKR